MDIVTQDKIAAGYLFFVLNFDITKVKIFVLYCYVSLD